jgi:hypothetical protein
LFPLPFREKYSPPGGRTGRKGGNATYSDLQSESQEPGQFNLGLRLPPTVIGIDVDAYAGKVGAQTLKELTGLYGQLPRTWRCSSRLDGISGIYLYTIPDGIETLDGWQDIDVVQWHHRYVVAPPSVHPTGAIYTWYGLDGQPSGIPSLYDLKRVLLPDAWLEHMQKEAGGVAKVALDRQQARTIIDQMPTGDPCRHVQAAVGAAIGVGAVHELFRTPVLKVVALGREGCPGAAAALAGMHRAFLAEKTYGPAGITSAVAEGEWHRLLDGAIAATANKPQGSMCVDRQLDWIDEIQGVDDVGELSPFQRMVHRRVVELQIADAAREAHEAAKLGAIEPGRIVILTEFLAEEDEDELFVVPGLWPADGRVLLVAAAKTGKTTTVVGNLLPALVDGGKFLGRYQVDPVDGVVGYLNLEVSERTMRAWLRRAGIEATGRVALMNLRGATGTITIGSAAGRKQFAGRLADAGITTLIVDPAAPLLAALGYDENSNSDVAAFFAAWSETMKIAGITADLIAHHTGHAGERSRGASRLLDEPDAIWTLTRDKVSEEESDDAGGPAGRYFAAYGRDVDHPIEALSFDQVTGRLTLTGTSKSQARSERGAERVLAFMADLVPRSKNEIMRGLGGERAAAYRIVENMISEGALIDTGLKSKGYPRWALST